VEEVISVRLITPIFHGDEEITVLELHEPTIGDLQKTDTTDGQVETVILTICACTGLPPSVIRTLKIRDLKAVEAAVVKMMGEESPPTGGRRQRGSPIPFTGRRAS
jgi:hypothetical protein